MAKIYPNESPSGYNRTLSSSVDNHIVGSPSGVNRTISSTIHISSAGDQSSLLSISSPSIGNALSSSTTNLMTSLVPRVDIVQNQYWRKFAAMIPIIGLAFSLQQQADIQTQIGNAFGRGQNEQLIPLIRVKNTYKKIMIGSLILTSMGAISSYWIKENVLGFAFGGGLSLFALMCARNLYLNLALIREIQTSDAGSIANLPGKVR
jgi:hypothetical protein